MTREEVTPKGVLYLKVVRNGKLFETVQENLIVTSGKNALTKLLGGETGMHVTQVGIGESASIAVPQDTGLINPVKVNVTPRIGIGLEAENGSLFNNPRIVQFHFVFAQNIAVGKNIREYGLFCADGTLFSRVARTSEFTKTSVDRLIGFWQITF